MGNSFGGKWREKNVDRNVLIEKLIEMNLVFIIVVYICLLNLVNNYDSIGIDC